MSWKASVLTLYPEMFPGPLNVSLAGKALQERIWDCEAHHLRTHGLGKHQNVDDTPSGGGPGMVLRADVLAAGIDDMVAENDGRPRILLTPRGRKLTQPKVRELSAGPGVVLVCGRFEGVDERIISARGLEEWSVGDVVYSGGEIAALALLDACVRLLPGVMGHENSGDEESFEQGLLEYPQYTRPAEFEGMPVPDVITSGDHAAVARWRHERAIEDTSERRPDLYADWLASSKG